MEYLMRNIVTVNMWTCWTWSKRGIHKWFLIKIWIEIFKMFALKFDLNCDDLW